MEVAGGQRAAVEVDVRFRRPVAIGEADLTVDDGLGVVFEREHGEPVGVVVLTCPLAELEGVAACVEHAARQMEDAHAGAAGEGAVVVVADDAAGGGDTGVDTQRAATLFDDTRGPAVAAELDIALVGQFAAVEAVITETVFADATVVGGAARVGHDPCGLIDGAGGAGAVADEQPSVGDGALADMQNGAGVGCRADEQRRTGPAVAGIIRVERGAGQSQDGACGGVGCCADGDRIGVQRVVAGGGQVEFPVVHIDRTQIGSAAREAERVRPEFFQSDEREVAREGEILVTGVEAEGGGGGCRGERCIGQGRELRVAEAVGGGAGGDTGDEGAGVGNGEARDGLRTQCTGRDGVEVALCHGGGAGVRVGRVEEPEPAFALLEQAAVSADGAGDGGGSAGQGIEARRA